MAQTLCLACLRRSVRTWRAPASLLFPTPVSFSTTRSQAKQASSEKGKKTLRLSRNKREKTGKPPAVGERRAFKRRVNITNPNAIQVDDLDLLDAGKLAISDASADSQCSPPVQSIDDSAFLGSYHGKVVAFEENVAQALLTLEMFRPTQPWRMFQRPCTVIRSETIGLAQMLRVIEQQQALHNTILVGPRGSGKSVLLLQAAAVAHSRGWIVFHIPEAKDLVNAHTSYRPQIESDGSILYVQPHYTAQLLKKVSRANHAVLSQLQLSQEHDLPVPVQSNISLARLAELGRDPELAWPIWQALWAEITLKSSSGTGRQRPPIMFSVDDLNNVMGQTAYSNDAMKPIHAHDLALVRHFNRLLTGQLATPNGCLAVAGTTRSNGLNTAQLDYHVEGAKSRGLVDQEFYLGFDQRVTDVLTNVKLQKVEGLTKDEAKGLIEYYARCGLLMNPVTDAFIAERWSTAGGGIVGSLERNILRPVV